MLYAILCYNSQEAVGAWTEAEDEAEDATATESEAISANQHK